MTDCWLAVMTLWPWPDVIALAIDKGNVTICVSPPDCAKNTWVSSSSSKNRKNTAATALTAYCFNELSTQIWVYFFGHFSFTDRLVYLK